MKRKSKVSHSYILYFLVQVQTKETVLDHIKDIFVIFEELSGEPTVLGSVLIKVQVHLLLCCVLISMRELILLSDSAVRFVWRACSGGNKRNL